MAESAGYQQFRHGTAEQVRRWGPSDQQRVAGSARLRGWQRFGRLLCAALGRVRVEGTEFLPAAGPVILAVNHTSAMDGTLLFSLLPRPVSFLVKAEAFQPLRGLAGRILIQSAQLPVRRQQIDPAPVRLSLQLLELGAVIGICPEGRRGDGQVHHARPGVGYLALKSGAAVIPVAVHGSAAMARRSGWRRPVVSVVFGAPIVLPGGGERPLNRQAWLAATEQIRLRLAELVRTTAPHSASGNLHGEKVDR